MQNIFPWLMLIIGIIIGWLISWLLGRSDKEEIAERLAPLEADLRTKTGELADCRARADALTADYQARISALEADLKARTADLDAARGQVAALEASAASLLAETRGTTIDLSAEAARPAVTVAEPEVGVDDFTAIEGIGPAFAARLSEAGITRYSDLAAVDPADLPTTLGLRNWQKIDADAVVAQAKVLAGRPRQIQIGDDLTTLEGIGPTYATRLRAAGIVNFDQLAAADEATLDEIISAPAWRRVNYGDWIAQARLAAAGDQAGLKALQDQLFSRQGDTLELIDGIGDTANATLGKAGIKTYADLAAATPEQLRAIFAKAGQRGGNYEAWIAEAKLRAAGKRVRRKATRTRSAPTGATQERSCPQDLEAVEGVGRVYEQRLYHVGVGTYWELGMLPKDQLAEILEVKDFQGVDLAAIKADAMRLAAETGTMGVMWDSSEPDDFTVFEGIGPVLERRLYAAGICTYEALAAATEQLLDRIGQLPAFQRPNYAAWIEQARERLT